MAAILSSKHYLGETCASLKEYARKLGYDGVWAFKRARAGLAIALALLTRFAPSEAPTLEQLLTPEGRSTLTTILAGHVVPGRLNRGDLVGAGSARTLATELADHQVPVFVGGS